MKFNNKLASLAVALPSLFAIGLTSSPAQAQRRPPEAIDIAHHAMRDKILHEAHDRFDVRFETANITPYGPGEREVTGRGFFRRRGKNPQSFTYHITVKPREGIAYRAGYDIR